MALHVKQTKLKGRGVFTDRTIRRGAIVEICPVIPLSYKEWHAVSSTLLQSYIFNWPGPRQSTNGCKLPWRGCAVVLGLGSLINHSDSPNSVWYADVVNLKMIFRATRDIKPGEEITHDYGWRDDMWGAYKVA